MDRALGPAGEHSVGFAASDQLCGLADRVRAGSARGHNGVVWAADPELDRELAARGVDEDVGEEAGRDPIGSALPEDVGLAHQLVNAADTATEDDADPLGPIAALPPASASASLAAESANRTLRSSLRTSFGEATPVAS